MRMARAWLILADILVTMLLLLSLILFYLYPPKPAKIISEKTFTVKIPAVDYNITFETLPQSVGSNVTMTWEEFMRFGAKDMDRYVVTEVVYNKYWDDPLEKRLEDLNATMGDPVYIRIFKEASLLEVWIRSGGQYELLKNYFICAYSGALGPKEKEGDKQAPEGFYKVRKEYLNPNSKFHLSFNLGYPNAYDKAHQRTGSFLMVHGNCVSIGCYAMTDEKIEEIYALVEKALKKGQKFVPVHIYPFKMTKENMADHSESKWYDFWTNLKEGYDYFETEKLPPRIEVKNGHYIITEANE